MPDGNWLAHTSRTFEIAKVLNEMDCEIIFAGEGEYMKLPKGVGFQVLPILTLDPVHALACSRSGRANWYDYDLIQRCVAAELSLFKQLKPDLVLTDFRLTLNTSCELANIPLAVTLNASWTNYYSVREKAPEHSGVTKILGKSLTTLFLPSVKKIIITFDSRPFNKFRRENKLSPRKNIFDIFRGDLNIIADIPDYGPTENLPEDFHYVGPIIWEPEMETPAWLEKLDSKRPTLYFTMGSTGHPRFFTQAIEIFGNTNYQCIMTTAGMADLQYIPDNFNVVDYAPGSQIMNKSDLVVCHGGNGTIYQAMSQGIPIIGIPTHHDQEWNLDRVESLGMGIHLSEINFKPAHLVEAVEGILSEQSYKENALKYKNILERYNGPSKGAQLIYSYLENN